MLGPVRRVTAVGDLRTVQSQLRRLGPAPTMAQLAKGQAPAATEPTNTGTAGLSTEQPSSQFRVFQQPRGIYQVAQPDNWSAYASAGGYGVTIVPRGGYETSSTGRQNITYGVIVNHYVPFEGAVGSQFTDPNGSMFGQTPLEEASSDLIRHILEANPHLQRISGTETLRTLSGQPTFSVDLGGRSPERGVDERVTVVSRQLTDDHVVYMLLIAPRQEYSALAPTFDRMVRSLRTDTAGAAHN